MEEIITQILKKNWAFKALPPIYTFFSNQSVELHICGPFANDLLQFDFLYCFPYLHFFWKCSCCYQMVLEQFSQEENKSLSYFWY